MKSIFRLSFIGIFVSCLTTSLLSQSDDMYQMAPSIDTADVSSAASTRSLSSLQTSNLQSMSVMAAAAENGTAWSAVDQTSFASRTGRTTIGSDVQSSKLRVDYTTAEGWAGFEMVCSLSSTTKYMGKIFMARDGFLLRNVTPTATTSSTETAFSFRNVNDYKMLTILANGNVGIGYTNPAYKLAVQGTINAKEIVVNTTGADFVFEEGYELKSLEEVESFIKENKHLPDIPPAEEMQQNGAGLGEMQTKLLQKIEELTLYMIELKKENKEIKEQNEQLSSKLNDLLK